MRRQLAFTNPFFGANYIENEPSLEISEFGIVINLGTTPLKVDAASSIAPLKSYLLRHMTLAGPIHKAVVVTFAFDPARGNADLDTFCANHWDTNKIRYPNDPSKWHYKILRSPIGHERNLEINCWFLPGNESSSIHNEHSFREIHTQVYGLGIMNKFTTPDATKLYQRMYMPPGFTHDVFYDAEGKYPWHQYEAVTNSIWLAVCES